METTGSCQMCPRFDKFVLYCEEMAENRNVATINHGLHNFGLLLVMVCLTSSIKLESHWNGYLIDYLCSLWEGLLAFPTIHPLLVIRQSQAVICHSRLPVHPLQFILVIKLGGMAEQWHFAIGETVHPKIVSFLQDAHRMGKLFCTEIYPKQVSTGKLHQIGV